VDSKYLAFSIVTRIIKPEEEGLDGLEEGERADGAIVTFMRIFVQLRIANLSIGWRRLS
jgi:hypothetical protein